MEVGVMDSLRAPVHLSSSGARENLGALSATWNNQESE